ncbi:hypothetical protein MA16_Dca029186 [Dendrobium catenatum]|uniref:TFIIS-type domain-containing protein n=1 Tax=Dendrobium catenatum TaxID=906689 RepID=A0A2I0VC66_9ASPA|nr:hypothetical protein MA16_Dca029186 [Dendrobium catenatum]
MSTTNFCPMCNNLLYHKEDRENRILFNVCKYCHYKVEADNYCVYRMEIQHQPNERMQTLNDAATNPNLPRTKDIPCPKCNHKEVALLPSTSRREVGTNQSFACCNRNCGHRWTE